MKANDFTDKNLCNHLKRREDSQGSGLLSNGKYISTLPNSVYYVRLLCDSNIAALAYNPGAIDSVSPVDGDNVLLTGQTDPKQNGIYSIIFGGAWVRIGTLVPAVIVGISEGTVYHDSYWTLISDRAIIGTDNLVFNEFPDKKVLINSSDIATHTTGFLDDKWRVQKNISGTEDGGIHKAIASLAGVEYIEVSSLPENILISGTDSTRDTPENKIIGDYNISPATGKIKTEMFHDVGTGYETLVISQMKNGFGWRHEDKVLTNHFNSTFDLAFTFDDGTVNAIPMNVLCNPTNSTDPNNDMVGDLAHIGETGSYGALLDGRYVKISCTYDSTNYTHKAFNIKDSVATSGSAITIKTGTGKNLYNLESAVLVYHYDISSAYWEVIDCKKAPNRWGLITESFATSAVGWALNYTNAGLNYNASHQNIQIKLGFSDSKSRFLGSFFTILGTSAYPSTDDYSQFEERLITLEAMDKCWFQISPGAGDGTITSTISNSDDLSMLRKATLKAYRVGTTLLWQLISYEIISHWTQTNVSGTHTPKSLTFTYPGKFPFDGYYLIIAHANVIVSTRNDHAYLYITDNDGTWDFSQQVTKVTVPTLDPYSNCLKFHGSKIVHIMGGNCAGRTLTIGYNKGDDTGVTSELSTCLIDIFYIGPVLGNDCQDYV